LTPASAGAGSGRRVAPLATFNDQMFFQTRQATLWRAHQIMHWRVGRGISASTSSVGTPRSISQVRRVLPYSRSMRSRNPEGSSSPRCFVTAVQLVDLGQPCVLARRSAKALRRNHSRCRPLSSPASPWARCCSIISACWDSPFIRRTPCVFSAPRYSWAASRATPEIGCGRETDCLPEGDSAVRHKISM
jgi:hypothetical protein